MKLVDILARELKEWPQGARWILYDVANGCHADMGAECIALGIDCSEFDGNPTTAVFEAGWQAAVDALNTGRAGSGGIKWNGEGLPPVDLPCQWHSDSQTGWQEVVVLAYSGESAWIQPKGKPSIIVGNPANFRPIRTPEQIAKQERSKACDKMYGVILDKIPQDRRNNGSDICEALYDAGYRKFEIVDN